jgi:hypothetical protein
MKQIILKDIGVNSYFTCTVDLASGLILTSENCRATMSLSNCGRSKKRYPKMEENSYTLVYNRAEGFDERILGKQEFIREVSSLLKKPKRIFLGLGDFLEIGDYNNLLDTIFFEKEGFSSKTFSTTRTVKYRSRAIFRFLSLSWRLFS